jgi:hypothetical protein
MVLETGKSKIKVLASDNGFLLALHYGRRAKRGQERKMEGFTLPL